MATTESTTENTAPATTEAPAPATPAKKRTTRKPSARKTAAKKAPAKKATKKAVSPNAGRKIRWTETEKFANGKNQHGTGLHGVQYKIIRLGNGEYAARMVTAKGVTTNLETSTTFSKAYWACVNKNKAAVEKLDAAAAKKATAPAA
jgi:hypothetical protein